MQGISSRSANSTPNKEKTFQGQQFDDDLGINWLQFRYRNHDPQIGRFIEIDPLANDYVYNSPYAFSENQVTAHVELEGLEKLSIQDLWRGVGISSSTDPKQFVKNVGRVAVKPQNIVAGYATATQIAAPIFLTTLITGGVGGPTVASAEVNSARASAPTATTETSLATRATELHSTLPARTQRATTTAVASATTSEGQNTTLVGFSEKNLRTPQIAALKPGEVAVSGQGHAEMTILNHAAANNMTVNAVAASRPICPSCATAINNAGAVPASPLKVVPQRPVADATYVRPTFIPPPPRN